MSTEISNLNYFHLRSYKKKKKKMKHFSHDYKNVYFFLLYQLVVRKKNYTVAKIFKCACKQMFGPFKVFIISNQVIEVFSPTLINARVYNVGL